MSTPQLIFIIFGAVLVAFGIWRILPRAVFFFTPGAVNGYFEAEPELPAVVRDYAAEVIGPIEALGYRLAGVLYEKPPLWRKAVETLVMLPDSSADFACIHISKRRVTYYFETLFTGGEVVITADGGFRAVDDGGLRQTVVTTEKPAEVLDRHRENVQSMISKGATSVTAHTPDIIAGSTRLYYSFPVVVNGMRRYGLNNLVLFVMLCIPLIIALA